MVYVTDFQCSTSKSIAKRVGVRARSRPGDGKHRQKSVLYKSTIITFPGRPIYSRAEINVRDFGGQVLYNFCDFFFFFETAGIDVFLMKHPK